MNPTLSACFAILAQALSQCAVTDPAAASSVMPIWQNDTAANTMSFQDTFGHQVSIGTYNPATGVWTAGSVSVGATFTGGLVSISGSPVTTPGTLAFTVAGTSGGIPYFSSATTWASSAILGANKLIVGGGAGSAPATPVGLGTTTQVLHGNASGAPTFGDISSADVATVLASPPAIGGTTPAAGSFTSLSSTTLTGAGINGIIASPPVGVGSVTPSTGAFTSGSFTSLIETGNTNFTNQGADGSTLYSTTGYGMPNTKSGLFTSGANLAAMRYISTYYAQTALYLATTQGTTIGETGLYISFNDNTGYQAPGGTTGQKTAVQISGTCSSGGGYCWDMAMSLNYASGWPGASGNFGAILELDPTNNTGTAPAPVGTSNMLSEWVNLMPGTNPVSNAIQITVTPNGTVLGAYNGIYIAGQYAIQNADVLVNTYAIIAFEDLGNHTNGMQLGGVYSNAALLINGTGAGPAITTASATFTVSEAGAVGAASYKVGANPGVTCSGTPTSSFTSGSGIVTHC